MPSKEDKAAEGQSVEVREDDAEPKHQEETEETVTKAEAAAVPAADEKDSVVHAADTSLMPPQIAVSHPSDTSVADNAQTSATAEEDTCINKHSSGGAELTENTDRTADNTEVTTPLDNIVTSDSNQVCLQPLVVITASNDELIQTASLYKPSSKSVYSDEDSALGLAVVSDNGLLGHQSSSSTLSAQILTDPGSNNIISIRIRSASLRKPPKKNKLPRRNSWQNTSTAGGKFGAMKMYSEARWGLYALLEAVGGI